MGADGSAVGRARLQSTYLAPGTRGASLQRGAGAILASRSLRRDDARAHAIVLRRRRQPLACHRVERRAKIAVFGVAGAAGTGGRLHAEPSAYRIWSARTFPESAASNVACRIGRTLPGGNG